MPVVNGVTYARSPAATAQGWPAAAPAHHVHERADPPAGAGVPAQRVHQPAAPLRAGRGPGADGDADQDLVPEQARQGQAHREGAARPAVQMPGPGQRSRVPVRRSVARCERRGPFCGKRRQRPAGLGCRSRAALLRSLLLQAPVSAADASHPNSRRGRRRCRCCCRRRRLCRGQVQPLSTTKEAGSGI